ncbi:cysteine desulfurase [Peptoniphilus ivorii]|uniref:cysteine desulfurase family protein n=1 Tax=Aedoeadaptatus ivorii TaxID=54006 RepID=UPI00278A591B|nr:cysteine desulfurase family protein [Peptoniphilus ivorii]MDQ0508984.1 cysteine desulfurase [Peptoniphilus ivorii]
MIYLDNCATTKPKDSVVRAVSRALVEDFSNPSSLHSFGFRVDREKEAIRKQICAYFGCREGKLYFTSGGTESNNTALDAYVSGASLGDKNVVTTNIEHPSVLNVLRNKEIELREVAVDASGHIPFEALDRAIDENTIALSLFHVNNELGSINPVEEWAPRLKAAHPALKVHIDGVQAVGKLAIDFDAIGCDSYSFSGHKFHGPKGIGGILLRRDIAPLIRGGGQEMGFRSGTENIPGIYGLGAAFRALEEEGIRKEEAEARVRLLRSLLEEIPEIRINTTEPASPYILNVSIPDTRGEVLLHILEGREIYISTSSACSSHRTGKNPVLTALGLTDREAEGTIRICMSRETTEEELRIFAAALAEAVDEVRSIVRR